MSMERKRVKEALRLLKKGKRKDACPEFIMIVNATDLEECRDEPIGNLLDAMRSAGAGVMYITTPTSWLWAINKIGSD